MTNPLELLIDTTEVLFDDAAASHPETLPIIDLTLRTLARAARLRSQAVNYRLSGRIKDALAIERASESQIKAAREQLKRIRKV